MTLLFTGATYYSAAKFSVTILAPSNISLSARRGLWDRAHLQDPALWRIQHRPHGAAVSRSAVIAAVPILRHEKGEFSYARELPLFYRPPCVAANVLRISNDWNKCCAGGSWHISSRGAVRDPDGLCMYRKAKYILLCIFSMTNFVVFIAKYFGYSDLRKSLP